MKLLIRLFEMLMKWLDGGAQRTELPEWRPDPLETPSFETWE